LRWDGNNDFYKGGLYFDKELKENYQNVWYLFSLEISDDKNEKNIVRIRNLKTNSVIWNSVSLGHLMLSETITNLTNFELLKTSDNLFNIRTKDGDYVSKETKNPFNPFEMFDIYSVDTTFSDSERAEIEFIEAENQSQIIDDKFILGTDLLTNNYYCIKSVNKNNENKFLKWDGMKYEYYYGLNLNISDDKDCPQNDEYYFEFEYEKNYKYVKIKNKGTNNYISFDKNNFFALTDHFVNYFRLNLILSLADFITIRTKYFPYDYSQPVYFGNNSNSNDVQQIPGVLSFEASERFTFIWVSGKDSVETTTGASNRNTIYFKYNLFSAIVIVLPLIFSLFSVNYL
jgi:hypothetical protein